LITQGPEKIQLLLIGIHTNKTPFHNDLFLSKHFPIPHSVTKGKNKPQQGLIYFIYTKYPHTLKDEESSPSYINLLAITYGFKKLTKIE